MRDAFRNFAQKSALGTPAALLLGVVVIAAWAALGPVFRYSDTWQLVINTGTTIVTFLMVFLIQSTQNRDSRAIHLKLDELLRAVKAVRTRLFGLKECTEEELQQLQNEFEALRKRAHLGSEPGRTENKSDS